MAKEEIVKINVHNDVEVNNAGIIRPMPKEPRDKSVWTKTTQERKLLSKMKNSCKKTDMHFHSVPQKQGKVCAKLIIQLKKNKTFPYTTYSQMCLNTQISDALRKFMIATSKGFESVVSKYIYNNKTYAPNERPYCG